MAPAAGSVRRIHRRGWKRWLMMPTPSKQEFFVPPLHQIYTAQNRRKSATSTSRRQPTTFSISSGGRPTQSNMCAWEPTSMEQRKQMIDLRF